MRAACKYILLLAGFFLAVVLRDSLDAHRYSDIALLLVTIAILQRWIIRDVEARWDIKIPGRGACKYILLLTGFSLANLFLDDLNAHRFWDIALLVVAIVISKMLVARDVEARWNIKVPW